VLDVKALDERRKRDKGRIKNSIELDSAMMGVSLGNVKRILSEIRNNRFDRRRRRSREARDAARRRATAAAQASCAVREWTSRGRERGQRNQANAVALPDAVA